MDRATYTTKKSRPTPDVRAAAGGGHAGVSELISVHRTRTFTHRTRTLHARGGAHNLSLVDTRARPVARPITPPTHGHRSAGANRSPPGRTLLLYKLPPPAPGCALQSPVGLTGGGGRVRGRSRALAAALTAPHLCLAAAALAAAARLYRSEASGGCWTCMRPTTPSARPCARIVGPCTSRC